LGTVLCGSDCRRSTTAKTDADSLGTLVRDILVHWIAV
jgi:hypothetical protein